MIWRRQIMLNNDKTEYTDDLSNNRWALHLWSQGAAVTRNRHYCRWKRNSRHKTKIFKRIKKRLRKNISSFQAAAYWDNVNAMNLLLIKGFVLKFGSHDFLSFNQISGSTPRLQGRTTGWQRRSPWKATPWMLSTFSGGRLERRCRRKWGSSNCREPCSKKIWKRGRESSLSSSALWVQIWWDFVIIKFLSLSFQVTCIAINGYRTVLTEAVHGGKIDFVRLLLDHG